MSRLEFVVFCLAFLLFSGIAAVSSWLCFKRTGIRVFPLLAAFLVLWPSLDTLCEALTENAAGTVLARSDYVFPLALRERPLAGEAAFNTEVGEFYKRQWATSNRLHAGKWLTFAAVVAIAFILTAHSCKRVREGLPSS